MDYLATHPCVDCGEKDVRVLEFDHLGNKLREVSAMLHNFTLEKVKTEIAKCQVLCVNCHRRKTAVERRYYTDIWDECRKV